MRESTHLTIFVPVVIALFVLLFVVLFIRACCMEVRERRRKRERAQAAALHREQAQARKQERDRAKASKPVKINASTPQPKRKRGRPRKEAAAPVPAPALAAVPQEEQRETVPASAPAIQSAKGNSAFAGQVVAFTGTLEGMTRTQAIKLVRDNGGKAFETMPVGIDLCTTMLVVADELMRSGRTTNKLEKADQYIGQIRKITETQFKAMLTLPLTLNPDEFAAMIAAQN